MSGNSAFFNEGDDADKGEAQQGAGDNAGKDPGGDADNGTNGATVHLIRFISFLWSIWFIWFKKETKKTK
jgi:hypothetical protein